MRFFDYIMFFLFGAAVGIFVYIFAWQKKDYHDPMPPEKQQVLLERINKVAKLVTVQGDYTGTHDYKDFYWADISMFSKQMILKTTAKISVGFDLQKATFEADSVNKIIRVRNLPKAEVIAIEHNTEIPFKKEGMFSGFSAADLTSINKTVKKKLQDSTIVAPLMQQAAEEGIAVLDIIKVLVEQGGWTFEMIDDTAMPKKTLEEQNQSKPTINNITNSPNIKN